MIQNSLELWIPLFLVALGGLYSQRAGMLNISLEGIMLTGAFCAFWGAEWSGSIFIGLGFALVAGLLLSLLFALGSLVLRGNIFIVGLAINLTAYPLISSLSQAIYHQGGTLRGDFFTAPEKFGWLAGQNIFFPLALLLGLISWTALERSQWGLQLKLLGASAKRLEQKDIKSSGTALQALLCTGGLAALGGAALSLPLESYVPGMSAGKGWVALVLIFLGKERVPYLALAALGFAFLEGLSLKAQGSTELSASVLLALPYFSILLVFGFMQWLAKRKKPDCPIP